MHNTSSHEEIIADTNLQEQTNIDHLNSQFVRIEITPKNPQKISRSPSDWTLRIDQDEKQVPEWYIVNRAKAEASAWAAWTESTAAQIILAGETRNEVTGDENIVWLFGTIETVGGSAQINYVGGSAKINYVGDSAKINYVRGSAQIIDVGDSAKINYVRGSAKIAALYDYATAQKNGVLYLSKTVKTKRINKKGII